MLTRRSLLTSVALAPLLGRLGGMGRAGAQAGGAVELETDIAYGEGNGEPLLLDVARPPAREAPRPAVLLLHGGSWSSGSRRDMAQPATKLAEAGYVTFNLEYRLLNLATGANRWPAQLDDVQRAVRWVRANAATYHVDPTRLAAYGHSAGGHLAAMLGVRETRDNGDAALADYSSRVSCVVDLAGPMDLTGPASSDADVQFFRNFLGGTHEEVPEVYRDASPITWVDEASVPFLLVHSSDDDLVPVAQAQQMAAALAEAGVEAVQIIFATGGHGRPASWTLSGPWIVTFLATQLSPNR
jgi:acetyl esterase/lipase